jgi:hypothetical protein
MHLDLNIVPTSLSGFCPIEGAVSAMVGSGIEARGAVFTRREVVDYLERYNILCRKLTQERLYTTATVMASPRTAVDSGDFIDLSELTSLKTFITSFDGHIAAEAARKLE